MFLFLNGFIQNLNLIWYNHIKTQFDLRKILMLGVYIKSESNGTNKTNFWCHWKLSLETKETDLVKCQE